MPWMLRFLPQRLKLFAAARLSALRKFAVGRKTRALLVENNDCLLLVGVEDMQVGRKLSSEGVYSSRELKRLLTLLNPQSDVLVLGGHIGALAIPLSKACRSLTVLEPNPDSFRLLELNLSLNHCDNVRPLNLAASDREEQLSFLASRANSGGSKRLPLRPDYRYSYDQPDHLSCRSAAGHSLSQFVFRCDRYRYRRVRVLCFAGHASTPGGRPSAGDRVRASPSCECGGDLSFAVC